MFCIFVVSGPRDPRYFHHITLKNEKYFVAYKLHSERLIGFGVYGPDNTIKIMSSRSVYINILFLGRFRPLSG